MSDANNKRGDYGGQEVEITHPSNYEELTSARTRSANPSHYDEVTQMTSSPTLDPNRYEQPSVMPDSAISTTARDPQSYEEKVEVHKKQITQLQHLNDKMTQRSNQQAEQLTSKTMELEAALKEVQHKGP